MTTWMRTASGRPHRVRETGVGLVFLQTSQGFYHRKGSGVDGHFGRGEVRHHVTGRSGSYRVCKVKTNSVGSK